MINSSCAIEVKNLSKVYSVYSDNRDRLKEIFSLSGKKYRKEFTALKDINFEVRKGETVAIIGRNGAGKSTLLKVLAGVLTPSRGFVNVSGRITSLLELGVGFNLEYTGIENIYQYGMFYDLGKEEMDKRLDRIIDFADIGDFIDKPLKTYSSGMFARLAFSVMINLDPEILIVDEALSVGDVFFQQKCNIHMKENMKNVTKLLVTHDLNSVVNLAERVIFIEHGQIIFNGDPLTAIELYLKSLHNDLYSNDSNEKNDVNKKSDENYYNTNENKEYDLTGFNKIDSNKLSGRLDVEIISYKAEVNCNPFSGVAKAGDSVTIKIQFMSKKDIKDVIVGYLVNDKYGKNIFGENTLTSGYVVNDLFENNMYFAELSFEWPEIKEDEYFVTIGIGEGKHEMHHVIQCWAHNMFKITNITLDTTLHALFNNKIKNFQIAKI